MCYVCDTKLNFITMKKTVIFLFLFAIAGISAQAQTSQNEQNIENFKQLRNSLEGYFQIQIIDSRSKPTISYEMLQEIESKRAQNQDVTFSYRSDMRILVVSKTSPKRFLTDEDKIVYIRSADPSSLNHEIKK
jgi:outer membrane lipoprotein-sorting protein